MKGEPRAIPGLCIQASGHSYLSAQEGERKKTESVEPLSRNDRELPFSGGGTRTRKYTSSDSIFLDQSAAWDGLPYVSIYVSRPNVEKGRRIYLGVLACFVSRNLQC